MLEEVAMTYDEALAYIAGLAPRGWRLGLDRMNELVRIAGLTDAVAGKSPRFVHVAGTNGKGSTTAFLQSLFVECGFVTGAFYSPYVFDPKERWQIGRSMISPDELAALVSELAPIAESLTATDFGGATEFEFKTALGFLYWHRHRCDWVALEVGLGGRLDATNVVSPAVSAIVSIGLDHTSILGSGVGLIAAEKAGIVKPGKPVVVGEVPREALEVIELIAGERGSPIWRYGREIRCEPDAAGKYAVTTPVGRRVGLEPGIVGARQPHNMALAVAALDASGLRLDESAIERGVRLASIPGRFQRVLFRGRELILDGGHNEDASRALLETLVEEYSGRTFALLTGMVQGHDPMKFFAPLKRLVSSAHVAPIDFFRAMPPEEVSNGLAANGISATVHGSLADALYAALESDDPVLATGSNYLLGGLAGLLSL